MVSKLISFSPSARSLSAFEYRAHPLGAPWVYYCDTFMDMQKHVSKMGCWINLGACSSTRQLMAELEPRAW